MGRGISFAEFRDALELWQQHHRAHLTVQCVVCGLVMPNSHPEFGSPVFDICDICVEQEQQSACEHDVGQMTFDFTF